jgi:hypothetical protein
MQSPIVFETPLRLVPTEPDPFLTSLESGDALTCDQSEVESREVEQILNRVAIFSRPVA